MELGRRWGGVLVVAATLAVRCHCDTAVVIALGSQGASCDATCQNISMACDEASMSAANHRLTAANISETLEGVWGSCAGVSSGKTWASVPYVSDSGWCFSSAEGRSEDSFSCGKASASSTWRRLCVCEPALNSSRFARKTARIYPLQNLSALPIERWGLDVMQPYFSGSVTQEVGEQLYLSEGFNLIRVPIWGAWAHAEPGVDNIDTRYYHNQNSNYNNWPAENVTFSVGDNGGGAIESALIAQAINPSTNVMLSLKLNEGSGGWSWPEWCCAPGTYRNEDTDTVVLAAQYAELLADIVEYVVAQGVDPKQLMLSPNTEMNPYTARVHVETMRNLTLIAANRSAFPEFRSMPFSEYYAQYYKVPQVQALDDNFETLDVFSFHNYGKYRDFRRNELLLMNDALDKAKLPGSFFSEVHSLGQDESTDASGERCVTDVDNAEDMLGHMFDTIIGGATSFVWWAYKGSEKACSPLAIDPDYRCTNFNNEVKYWMVHSAPVGSKLLLTDDHDGRVMKFGTLMTAAWRNASRVSVWVVNNSPNITCGVIASASAGGRSGDGTIENYLYTYELASGTLIDGDVFVYQYVGPFFGEYGMVESRATKDDKDASFEVSVPAYSFTVIDFDVIDEAFAKPATTSATFVASTSGFIDSKYPDAVASFGDSLVVDATDKMAFVRFDVLDIPSVITRATIRVFAETPSAELLVATVDANWTAETLTYSSSPSFDYEAATTLDGIAAGDAGELAFDVTLAVSSGLDPNGQYAFAFFTEGQKSSSTNNGITVPTVLLASRYGSACATAYLDVEYVGEPIVYSSSSLSSTDEDAGRCEPSLWELLSIASAGESCDAACQNRSLICTEDVMVVTNEFTTEANMGTTLEVLGEACTGVSSGKTWGSAPYITTEGYCFSSTDSRSSSTFDCSNTGNSAKKRICPCVAYPTTTPTPAPTSLSSPLSSPSPSTAPPSPAPTSVSVPAPTSVPVPSPTSPPAPSPTSVPAPSPTSVPVPAPSPAPTPLPTRIPEEPSAVPVPTPTAVPFPAPTSAPIPAPTPVPGPPVPTVVPFVDVSLTLGLSGLACSQYGSAEESVVNAALAEQIGGGVAAADFDDHVCTDGGRRRGLLSSAILIATAVSIDSEAYGAASSDALANAVASSVASAVSSGGFTSSVASAAADASLTTLSSVTVIAASAAKAAAAPSAAPTAAWCALGLTTSNVCCADADQCDGRCGGGGCSNRPGGRALCCFGAIRRADVCVRTRRDITARNHTRSTSSRSPVEPSRCESLCRAKRISAVPLRRSFEASPPSVSPLVHRYCEHPSDVGCLIPTSDRDEAAAAAAEAAEAADDAGADDDGGGGGARVLGLHFYVFLGAAAMLCSALIGGIGVLLLVNKRLAQRVTEPQAPHPDHISVVELTKPSDVSSSQPSETSVRVSMANPLRSL